MSYLLKQSQTARPLLFLLLDSTDHVTGKTGRTPTVTLSKNGAAFASPAGAVTELANGWYKVAANATDTATLGPLILHATATASDDCDVQFDVVAFDPDAMLSVMLADAVAHGGATATLRLGSSNPAVPALWATQSDINGWAIRGENTNTSALSGAGGGVRFSSANSTAGTGLFCFGTTDISGTITTVLNVVTVSGNVSGKVIGGGATTITGIGAQVNVGAIANGTITSLSIADGAITDAKITFPAETAGRPTTFLAAMRRVWEWVVNKRTRNRTTGALALRNAADNGTLESQTQSTAGAVGSETDTQTQGS